MEEAKDCWILKSLPGRCARTNGEKKRRESLPNSSSSKQTPLLFPFGRFNQQDVVHQRNPVIHRPRHAVVGAAPPFRGGGRAAAGSACTHPAPSSPHPCSQTPPPAPSHTGEGGERRGNTGGGIYAPWGAVKTSTPATDLSADIDHDLQWTV